MWQMCVVEVVGNYEKYTIGTNYHMLFPQEERVAKIQLNGLIIDTILGYDEIIYFTHTTIESIVIFWVIELWE